jgi:hypothetical protein
MGTKNNPGAYDCYANAAPDEPMFVLLGRDKHAPTLVWLWATLRELDGEDPVKVAEARECVGGMIDYATALGKPVVGLGQAALSGVMEMVRAVNCCVKGNKNHVTGDDVMRLFLAETTFDLAEAPAALTDDAFVQVPEVTLPGGIVVPPFQVGQYLCTKRPDGSAAVSATDKPWVNINYHDAKTACEKAGVTLINELQCLAIAHDIANQDINWTGGKVGSGMLFQGLRKGNVSEAQPGSYVSPDEDERRWFQLSNGERIFDAAGNAFTWVFDNVQGNEAGIVASKLQKDSPSLATAPYASLENGVGWRPSPGSNLSGIALIRGGCWRSGGGAGVFALGSGWPDDGSDRVGFRCTK